MTKSFRMSFGVLSAFGLLVESGHGFAAGDDRLDGKSGFAKMKELAGEWTNKAEGQTVIFRVMSKGKSVMEILYAGTDHEMITMYYMDGDDLVATHYCAQGNQPRMRLDTMVSKDSRLVFDFTGGTNLDPAKDTHMHAQRFTLVDRDHLTVERDGYEGGKKSHTHKVEFTRGEPATWTKPSTSRDNVGKWPVWSVRERPGSKTVTVLPSRMAAGDSGCHHSRRIGPFAVTATGPPIGDAAPGRPSNLKAAHDRLTSPSGAKGPAPRTVAEGEGEAVGQGSAVTGAPSRQDRTGAFRRILLKGQIMPLRGTTGSVAPPRDTPCETRSPHRPWGRPGCYCDRASN